MCANMYKGMNVNYILDLVPVLYYSMIKEKVLKLAVMGLFWEPVLDSRGGLGKEDVSSENLRCYAWSTLLKIDTFAA